MTVAEYFTDGALKSLSSDGRCDGYLKIKINSSEEENLTIGKKLFKIKKGSVTISPRDLTDGELLPKLYTKNGTVFLEGLFVKDKAISPAKSTTDLLVELRRAFYSYNEKLLSLQTELSALKQKISKGVIF